jgi:hypothetical protein
LRTPDNILEGPDTNYELQIVDNMMSTSHIDSKIGTGEATVYRHYPGLELIITGLSTITGIGPILLLKYFGVILGLLTIVFLERFFFTLFRDMRISVPSAFIAGLCPFLIGMNSYTIHQAIALCFLTLFLWSGTQEGIKWKLISLIALFGIVVSHHLTTYILIFIIMIMIFTVVLFKYILKFQTEELIKRQTIKFFGLIVLIGSLIVLIFSPQIMIRTISQLVTDITSNIFSPSAYSFAVVSPTGVKPLWIVLLETIGFLTFGLLVIISYFKVLRRKEVRISPILSYATAGLIIFVGFLLVWISGLSYAKEVQWRGLIYLYIFTSPLFIVLLQDIHLYKPRISKMKSREKALKKTMPIIIVALLIFVSSNSIYHGIGPSKYDIDAPYTYSDLRLNLEQWQASGAHARNHEELDYSWGVRLAWEQVGGYGQRIILPLRIPAESNLSAWIESHDDQYFYLRKSIVQVPDYDGLNPSEEELNYIVENNDLIYTTGEIILLKAGT